MAFLLLENQPPRCSCRMAPGDAGWLSPVSREWFQPPRGLVPGTCGSQNNVPYRHFCPSLTDRRILTRTREIFRGDESAPNCGQVTELITKKTSFCCNYKIHTLCNSMDLWQLTLLCCYPAPLWHFYPAPVSVIDTSLVTLPFFNFLSLSYFGSR